MMARWGNGNHPMNANTIISLSRRLAITIVLSYSHTDPNISDFGQWRVHILFLRLINYSVKHIIRKYSESRVK